MSLWTKQGHLCSSLPVTIDITVFIFKIQMEVALSWMPEWKNGQAREATKVFNIQPTMTPHRHQFAFHLGNDQNLVHIPLISAWTCCNPPLHFSVWNAHSLNTKVLSLCNLLLSHLLNLLSVTESWLTLNDSITIANLINSLKDYAVYNLPRSTYRGGEFIITQ